MSAPSIHTFSAAAYTVSGFLLQSTTSAKMGEQVKLFGQPFTMQRAWILGTTHLHEHLGQLIAYARTNGVKPPWSR